MNDIIIELRQHALDKEMIELLEVDKNICWGVVHQDMIYGDEYIRDLLEKGETVTCVMNFKPE